MAVQVSYPGVYIQEFTPGAPIQGVGTSTAAFLGPSSDAGRAPLNEPVRITSWDRFLEQFGDRPLDGFYLWYAVRGFFENGGRVCYVTRVSNAKFDQLNLLDQASQATIQVRARRPGSLTPPINVQVDGDVHAVTGATLFRPTAEVEGDSTGAAITVTEAADAARFRPADVITVNGTDTWRITRVSGTTIRLDSAVQVADGDTVRLADLVKGDTIFRVQDADKLASGSVIEISQGSDKEIAVVKSVIVETLPITLATTYRVELTQGLANGYGLSDTDDPVQVESFEFSLTVTGQDPDTGQPYNKLYPELSMRPEHPNYYRAAINNDESGIIYADPVEPPSVTAAPDNRPVTLAVASPLTGGAGDDLANLGLTDYAQALSRLEKIDDVNLVAIPDRTDLSVQVAIIAHCEKMHDRFAILDSPRNADTGGVEFHLAGVQTSHGHAALYYPWLWVPPASGNDPILVPPSGHVAGIHARIDNSRGVHKAPAGNEALINGALGVATSLSDDEQGLLNLQGINVIRVFRPGGRPVVWGARTTATELDTNWQYVNIRRLFLFLEESIEEGIRWAVFEPNNRQLWQKLKRTITEFLTRVWRDGALFGAKAEDAFYVRIDEALNPFSEQQLGRLYIEIGVRPTYAAEFIIVRIGIWAGGSEVSES